MSFRGDLINTLPTDSIDPAVDQIRLVNSIFEEHTTTLQKLSKEFKDGVVIAILFVIFSLPLVDDLIKKVVPSTTSSSISLMIIKALVVVIVYYFVKNIHLSRK